MYTKDEPLNRKTVSLTASENLRVAITQGNAVLVQLTGTGWSGSVDFKSSPVIQFRIDVVVSGGTLDVVYRELNIEN